MRAIRLSLLLGGLFNLSMGSIFFSNRLLQWFFSTTEHLETSLFGGNAQILFPSDAMHLLLIHGFGAGVLILGATLLYSYGDPRRFLPFIFLDGLGRLLYGLTMVYYVLHYELLHMILVFGLVELSFAVIYLWGSWYLFRRVPATPL